MSLNTGRFAHNWILSMILPEAEFGGDKLALYLTKLKATGLVF